MVKIQRNSDLVDKASVHVQGTCTTQCTASLKVAYEELH